MLRALYSGISGLRSHQTMLDVTGNNIANVNTTAFKGSSVEFQDTLSQLVRNSTLPQEQTGGSNPAQVGLGVQVASVSTNFAQGAAQSTGVPTHLMIAGDGFFVVRSGADTAYTRNGAFKFDAQGRMVTSDGAFVQGWSAQNGVINPGATVGTITLPVGAVSPPAATTTARVTGNLPSDAEVGEELVRDVTVYDDEGTPDTLSLTFTRTATGWSVATDGGATADLTFTDGELSGGGTLTAGPITIDMTALSGFAELSTVTISGQNGRAAGTLQSYALSEDGSLVGTFSNGQTQVLARVALATFINPEGLEKAGSSQYRPTVNSGQPAIGEAGVDGMGSLISGALEMSNVDLSQEFTNLIVAQRGFQANARIITTSDEVLQELTNLKR
ncbi:flagellar hook protein FlgE [Microbacterium sp.]|uniref:flagellar hook protein FlgE n=1 Tax=Microbacterium sp. TaxID=51671 RepID=UPI002811F5E4|nr:flagellar hook protein FlgE [Microbacterium sp.]